MQRYEKNKLVIGVGEEGLKKFKEAKVLIFGAGGVGTNLIVNLAALGIGHIGLVDNDKIEMRNIAIQPLYDETSIGRYKVDVAKEWVEKYNPYIDFKTYNVRLDETNYAEIVKDYDIFVDAFDTLKSVRLENKIAVKTNKPIVYTGTINMFCQVNTTIPGKTPCFDCYVEHEQQEENNVYGVFQSMGAIAAGIQTNEVIKLILKTGYTIGHSPEYGPLIYDGLRGIAGRSKIYRSKTRICKTCGLPLVGHEKFKE